MDETTTRTDILANLPVTEWDAAFSLLPPNAQGEIDRAAGDAAVRYAMLCTYAMYRGGAGCGDHGHDEALKRARRIRRRLRRVLGYTYP